MIARVNTGVAMQPFTKCAHGNRQEATDMDHLFEMLLEEHRAAVERFVRFRLPSKPDADDTLQEVYIAAYQKFAQLKNRDAFKAWLLAIARNKCNA